MNEDMVGQDGIERNFRLNDDLIINFLTRAHCAADDKSLITLFYDIYGLGLKDGKTFVNQMRAGYFDENLKLDECTVTTNGGDTTEKKYYKYENGKLFPLN